MQIFIDLTEDSKGKTHFQHKQMYTQHTHQFYKWQCKQLTLTPNPNPHLY